jgi:hypothetical protein
MRHPFEAISPGRRGRYFWPLLALTLILSVVMSIVGRLLLTRSAPSGIVSYELAGDVSLAQQMITSWDATARAYAAFGLGLDFLYLVLYSTTIGLACVWVADISRARHWPLAGLGAPLAWGLWLAALCDAIENIGLTVMLLSVVGEPWPLIARWCAIVKFSLIVIGLIYVLGNVLAQTAVRLFRK